MFRQIWLSQVICLLSLMLLLTGFGSLHAQSEEDSNDTFPNPDTNSSATITNTVTVAQNLTAEAELCPPPNKSVAKVTGIRLMDHIRGQVEEHEFVTGNLDDVELGKRISLRVEDLSALYAEAACENEDIILYLNDRPLVGTTPEPPSNPTSSILHFPLRRTDQTHDVWSDILGSPTSDSRLLRISVGLENAFAIPSDVEVELDVLRSFWIGLWISVVVILMITFFVMAYRSDILRDIGPPVPNGKQKQYSLARVQAACWFFIILVSYLFISTMTDDYGSAITGTVLGLMGISLGTTVGSAFVDASKADTIQTRKKDVEEKVAEVSQLRESLKLDKEAQEQRVKDLKEALTEKKKNETSSSSDDIAEAEAQLRVAKSKLDEIKDRQASTTKTKTAEEQHLKKLSNESENFLVDILSDASGLSFHRFQIFAWTLVLGIIFIYQVYRNLAMPEFDASLLAVLGISAGTYLGFKIPEDTAPK